MANIDVHGFQNLIVIYNKSILRGYKEGMKMSFSIAHMDILTLEEAS
jgi:hypothetical protein